MELPDGLERVGNAWFSESAVQKVVIPRSVKELGNNAFRKTHNLKEIVFREGSRLEKIGNACFDDSRIEVFTAPNLLKEIGD